jgi:zinc/manganese transport system substrate-binding protein
MKRWSIVLVVLMIIGGGTIWSVGQSHNNSVDTQKLQIVAAENFWGNITSQIGGDSVQVTSIISNPNTDPHLYESDAHDAAALSHANLVIKNGLGYDSFMDKLMAASPNSHRQVLSVEKILAVSGQDPNPHLWYDIPRIPEVADAIEQNLAAQDPKNKAIFESNLASFKLTLQPVYEVINKIKSKYPNAPVSYTERVPGYLLSAADLAVKTPAGFAGAIEQGNDPSPSDTATMEALMTNKSVRVLLYNAQATSMETQRVRNLAGQVGIPIVGVTETLPPSEHNYQSWQLDQATALLKALGG